MEIIFNNPKNPLITKLTIIKMIDIPVAKAVRVRTKEIKTPITLWKDAEYDAIGQWNDTDVNNRLQSLYNN